MKSYNEFLAEGKKGLTNAGTIMKTDNVTEIPTSVNFADETLEVLRRKLLDIFLEMADGDESKNAVNKCISTYVYCIDKKMRIDGEIMDRLAKEVGKTNKEVTETISKETDSFYGKSMNIYGMT